MLQSCFWGYPHRLIDGHARKYLCNRYYFSDLVEILQTAAHMTPAFRDVDNESKY